MGYGQFSGCRHWCYTLLKVNIWQMALDKDGNPISEGGDGDEGGISPELKKQLEELALKNKELSSSVSKLTAKNEELIGENRKRSRVDRILKALEIDPDAEDAENLLMEKLSAGLDKNLDQVKAAATPPGSPAPAASDPNTLEMKSQLSALQRKLAEMEKKAKEAEKREQEAIEKRKRDYIELKVKEALQKADCLQPAHLYRLQMGAFRLSDDGETVIGGTEADPRSLQDAVEALKDDPEWAMYFRGSGATGGGMAKQGGFGGQSLKNPFRSDQLNLTEASNVLTKDRDRAKRLIIEARSAGKLAAPFEKLSV